MKEIHFKNSKGQNVCSAQYRKNKYNEIVSPKNPYEIDKNLLCIECAKTIGNPYFSPEEIFEMELKRYRE